MSVEDELVRLAANTAFAAATELLKNALHEHGEEVYQAGLDELAERAHFEAEGNRKLLARRKRT